MKCDKGNKGQKRTRIDFFSSQDRREENTLSSVSISDQNLNIWIEDVSKCKFSAVCSDG